LVSEVITPEHHPNELWREQPHQAIEEECKKYEDGHGSTTCATPQWYTKPAFHGMES